MAIYNSFFKIKNIYIKGANIGKAYRGEILVYNKPALKNTYTITYKVDADIIYTETVDASKSVLNPITFVPTKDGYTFVGWRTDSNANRMVLIDAVAISDMTLYAVFSKSYTVSYNGNSSTSGSTDSQTAISCYNNGNISDATIILAKNGFTKTDYTFSRWAVGSTSGTQYKTGASVTITEDTTFYAVWKETIFNIPYTMSKVSESYSGQNGEASHNISWSNTGVTINYSSMSYGGGIFVFATSSKLDLSDCKSITITYKANRDWEDNSRIGIGSSRDKYDFVSTGIVDDGEYHTVTLDVSNIESGYLVFYYRAYINTNVQTSRSFYASITSIQGSLI